MDTGLDASRRPGTTKSMTPGKHILPLSTRRRQIHQHSNGTVAAISIPNPDKPL
jgi:hypothetical protein